MKGREEDGEKWKWKIIKIGSEGWMGDEENSEKKEKVKRQKRWEMRGMRDKEKIRVRKEGEKDG